MTVEMPAKAAARLRSDVVAWLTTVRDDNMPQTSPIWFLWEGDEITVYSRAQTPKLANVEATGTASFNLDGNGMGGDIVTIEAAARIDPDAPAADQVPVYVEKYREHMERIGHTPETFAAAYPVAIVLEPLRVRAW